MACQRLLVSADAFDVDADGMVRYDTGNGMAAVAHVEMYRGMLGKGGLAVFADDERAEVADAIHVRQGFLQQQIGECAFLLPLLMLETQCLLTPPVGQRGDSAAEFFAGDEVYLFVDENFHSFSPQCLQ